MIPRRIAKLLRKRLAAYPAVALVGPRQAGKTTLARGLKGIYFDLEQEPERLRLDLEWDGLIDGKELIILDEAQAWPPVFARLRSAIDGDRRRMGRFLLLGSVSPALMVQVSESLAGRLAMVELSPLLWEELPKAAARSRLWLCGGFPDGGVLRPGQYPRWQHNYVALLTQRDLPLWGMAAKPPVTQRMLAMLAAVHGQAWNASRIGQSLGLSHHTVATYLDYLVGAYLIRLLPPFHANLRKRLVKSHKLYWRDSGLLHATLNVENRRNLLLQPWVGASWEGFVIEQVLGHLSQQDRLFQAFYLRTSDQQEIDLLLDFSGKLWAMEIKLTASPSPQDMSRLERAADLVGAERRFLISQTRTVAEGKRAVSCNLPWLLREIGR